MNPWYVTGLVEGEGCFCVTISKHKTKRLGLDPRLMFEIEMVIDYKPLLLRLQDNFNCGQVFTLSYERYGWRPHVKYAVKSHEDIRKKIIPFFKKYELQGKKKKDFEYFCKAAEIFSRKEHLTLEGIESLRRIQSKMNIRRKLKQSSARVRENREPSGERSIVE